MEEHRGGRLAANFRPANIAEGLAVQMLRPFSAVAPVPRDEDFGIDLIGTLLRRKGKVYVAENSFAVQVKKSTAAEFPFAGEGLKWLRELDIPYFPLVVNLRRATASLFTVNEHRRAYMLHSAVPRINFTVDGDGLDDFPLGDPLMSWSLEEAAHPDFGAWAYAVLKPAIEVEAWNQHYAAAQSIRDLVYETQWFAMRKDVGSPQLSPRPGTLQHTPPGDSAFIRDAVTSILEPFVGWISNDPAHNHQGKELLIIRDAFRRLGLDPDPENTWDEIVSDMEEFVSRHE